MRTEGKPAPVVAQRRGLEAVASTRKLANGLPQVRRIREEIFFAWVNGQRERSLSATYERTRESIEETCREQAREWMRRKAA